MMHNEKLTKTKTLVKIVWFCCIKSYQGCHTCLTCDANFKEKLKSTKINSSTFKSYLQDIDCILMNKYQVKGSNGKTGDRLITMINKVTLYLHPFELLDFCGERQVLSARHTRYHCSELWQLFCKQLQQSQFHRSKSPREALHSPVERRLNQIQHQGTQSAIQRQKQ